MFKPVITRRGATVVALLLVELVDELVDGARNSAWPMMRADLNLSYEQIGMLLSIPAIIASVIEPAIGLLGDTWRRRRLILGGGIAFSTAVAATGWVNGWIALLVAFVAFYPASGAFVGLSQATLMDLAPERQEQNMARWVVAGSLGVVGGSALVGLLDYSGNSWRTAFVVLGVSAAVVLILVGVTGAGRVERTEGESTSVASTLMQRSALALRALRRADVRRWLILLQSADLMLDVFGGLLALYLVDVAHGTSSQAVLGVALFTGVGLAGDALLVPLLERVDGIRYLRASVLLTAIAFPAFLLVPSIAGKFALIACLGLLNSGWYSIPQARLYSAMPGQSATVMTLSNLFGLLGGLVPLVLGAVAGRVGLAPTMWLLMIGPVVLLVGLLQLRSDKSIITIRE